jgi:transglutaminase-like putative cysteine protease
MTVLKIRHRTTYRYREPVRLGPHRLMLRPRESRVVRLLSSTLETTPAASVSWTNDVFGNAVATADFAGLADGLVIESRAAVELAASA